MDGMISGNKGCPGKGADEERMTWCGLEWMNLSAEEMKKIAQEFPGLKKNECKNGPGTSKSNNVVFLSNMAKPISKQG